MPLSYTEAAVTEAEADAYAQPRGWSDWAAATADDKTAALRRGQDAIAGLYNARWTVEFENDDAPDQVKFAIVEAAWRELAKPGSMQPDMARGGKIKSAGAGPAQVTFADGAPVETTFKAIDGLLAGLVGRNSTTTFGFVARA